ncbi:uncharacterized protein BJ212DRAFT_791938 [Suillus subaureus]|uniref:Uncharacterized protein n=1 Tax=Suillus subaureus TaxID=48587 RepID=A0A9P7J744_9AGAM|nr:uncharacterized protein BJ212DRAFT_791938 [Suillus subaureus]KAG1806112.1 hypothetical protein BJ212DRAFT_791938 [Suillus subaureus]
MYLAVHWFYISGCTHHIFMIFLFMSKFLCLLMLLLSSCVVLSSFRTIFVLSFSSFVFLFLFYLFFLSGIHYNAAPLSSAIDIHTYIQTYDIRQTL